MHCPYCHRPVAEEAGQCAACGLDLVQLDRVLGIPPVIPAGLTDAAGVLGRKGARQVNRAMARFCQRFPQIQMALVVQETPVVVPLRTWAWWLFNRGHFSAALHKGFMNRDLLLALDPGRRQLALTMGYGMEPFVGTRDLVAALEAGEAALAEGQWADACRQTLVALDHRLQIIVGRMPRTYGVPMAMAMDTGEPAELASW